MGEFLRILGNNWPISSTDDIEFSNLLTAVRANAPWAWERLYRMYAPRLLGFLSVRNRESAEDVLANVFFDVVRQLHSFDGGAAEFQTWIFRIAHNRFIDEYRRETRRKNPPPELHGRGIDEPDVAAVYQEREAEQRVMQLLSALPDDQRSAVYLRTIVGMSFADVAAAMDRSIGSAKMLHKRALKTIGDRLALTHTHIQDNKP